MFDCGTPEDFRCGFDASSMFQSAALYINRHAFEKSRYSHQENHRSELNRLNEVLGEGLGEEDEDELLRDGIQSARSMMQDTQPLSRYASRRGGYDMAGNQLNGFSNSLRENEEPKFTGRFTFDYKFSFSHLMNIGIGRHIIKRCCYLYSVIQYQFKQSTVINDSSFGNDTNGMTKQNNVN